MSDQCDVVVNGIFNNVNTASPFECVDVSAA